MLTAMAGVVAATRRASYFTHSPSWLGSQSGPRSSEDQE
jgi:hypothetical protein